MVKFVELNSKEKFKNTEYDKSLDLCRKYNEVGAYVSDKKVKKDKMNPPKIIFADEASNYLGKKYKMPMDKVLRNYSKTL